MIFVAVGTQLPFERLVDYVEKWLDGRDVPAFGQLAKMPSSRVVGFPSVESIELNDFRVRVERCGVLVSHAGMGNIITALELGRPIVIVPRVARFGEHRNDHQLDTAAKFKSYSGVFVATEYEEFTVAMMRALAWRGGEAATSSPEKDKLLATIRAFVAQ